MSKKLLSAAVIVIYLLSGCASEGNENRNRTRSMDMPENTAGVITVEAAEQDGLNSRELGRFSTEFNAKEKRRVHNIRRASNAIDQCIVQPGETFSYNETVGPTSKRRGYQLSTIFIRGEKFEGYGGGVCQVSSTLYNAAANAGMTIVERHDHSRPVPYVETGKDAATSYGGIDFKFKNDEIYPVRINSHVEEGNITVTINAV